MNMIKKEADLLDRLTVMMKNLNHFRPKIEALASRIGTHSMDDIVYMVVTGKMRLWMLSLRTFMITEIIQYPQRKEYRIFMAGGNINELVEAEPLLIEAAKEAECSHISLEGRKGWVKALSDKGAVLETVICTRRV